MHVWDDVMGYNQVQEIDYMMIVYGLRRFWYWYDDTLKYIYNMQLYWTEHIKIHKKDFILMINIF